MKLLFHSPVHHKNTEGIILMCTSRSIDIEFTTDDSRVLINNYDILIMNTKYIDPSLLPSHIKIIYGPQLFGFPSGQICGPLQENLVKRAAFNSLSKWVSTWCYEFSDFIVPHAQFPFAVNIDKFTPSNVEKNIDCIIYIKHRPETFINSALNIITSKNINTIKFVYGTYNEDKYLQSLQRAKFMITLDAHESQGFALQEAMSCNVPLLVLDVETMKDEYPMNNCVYNHMDKKMICTSVPYWDNRCGIKINTVDELSSAIDRMLSSYGTFNPREYILETLSPEVCMDRILTYFGLKNNT